MTEDKPVMSESAKLGNEAGYPNSPPRDSFRLTFIIFYFIGIGTLLPWNFFITANQYFQYQLRNQSLTDDVDPLLPQYRTELQKVFSTYLTISSMVPATLGNFLNLLIKDWLPVYPRLLGSSAVMLTIFIITTIFTKVSIDTYTFFTLTLATVAINNVASAINQGSTYGILSVLPGSNVRGFLEGQAVAGIIAAVASIITIAAASSPTEVGFAYFLIAVGIIALTIFLFIVLFKNPYFQYYWSRRNVAMHDDASLGSKIRTTFKNLYLAMYDVKWTGITTFFIFTCTLSVFPSVFILLIPVNFDDENVWHTKYFHAVIVFLNFNISDYVGRMLVTWFKWPKFEQRRILMFLAIARFLLVPLALLCNIDSERFPALLLHDSFPFILVMLLGLTNGYFVSLAVGYAPKYATPGNEEGCGIATSTYIALGLVTGVAMSYGLVALV
ncbi:unnamed protein product [Hymenolepis diminuta]|uniref:Equilibrative nucleoside transporter 1-like n=1 Tax=Hymenolepis diminuta TaxID=6216 RepID=A0A0R3STI1_HYMDI|nr:unnamed protein product [Hymenolepis diminuta]VUZ43005.1 unnamed protein product [Hymenolepis diminuta]